MELREILQTGNIPADTSQFWEACQQRLLDALRAVGTPYSPGLGDIASLVRHVLRREDELQGGTSQTLLKVPRTPRYPDRSIWQRSGMTVLREGPDYYLISARAWQPEWLELSDRYPPDVPIFNEESRRKYEPVSGDPFLDLVDLKNYRSVGQREAVHAVLTAPLRSTLIINLPTGSGKSLCAQLPALLQSRISGISVVVVPTTALAIDQERALKPFINHPTAYYGDESLEGKERRQEIRDRIRAGTQRIIFTSPESLIGSLAPSLYEAAKQGMLRYFVIDEAHMVEQWGDEFRPAFQELPGLRRDLLRLTSFTTLLLSATLTESCLDTLETLFGQPGPFQVISAVQLRPEPSYWFAWCQSEDLRKQRLLEAIYHLPRPLIIYATKVADEQFAQLLEIEPAERIPQLESLSRKYPRAVNVLLALAESYAATDNTEHALKIYQSVPVKSEEVQRRYAELLLASERFREVIKLLPDSISELSPALAGLRGAALYNLGQKTQARELLEKAWLGGERKVQVLLPLARLWSTEGDPERAAAVYQILQETANEKLTLEDYALIAMVANLGGFGDICDEQKVNYYEEYVTLAGSRLLSLSAAKDILKDRLDLWKRIHKVEGLLNAYADWLDWLANAGHLEDLNKDLADLRSNAGTQQINRKQHFELLESLELYVDVRPSLRQSLANDYFGLALTEIDNALRQAQAEEPFFQDLKRVLLNLDRELVQELVEYRQKRRAEAQKLEIQIASEDDTVSAPLNLSSLRLALVGGHEATRREVIRELKQGYSLKDTVEIAPSSEAYVDRSSVQAKISDCDLIAVITGYMGHDLSQIVSNMKKDGALVGEVLLLPCRGKSGIVRNILNWWVGR